jgi:TLD
MILEQTRKRHSSRPLLIRQYLALQILMFGLVTMISRRSCHAFLTGHVVFNARQISFLPRMAVLENTFATYEMSEATVPEDKAVDDAELVRPLLKHTQLETRPLQVAYDANRDGWDPMSFHQGVDAKGATVIVAREKDTGRIFGGYNPKGFCSYGGARPSVAAFLFYEKHGIPGKFQKLQKLKDGKLSCARDDADFGISFGTSDLVVGLQLGNERQATSRLGEYFECGPENLASLFGKEIAELEDLKVLVGCYGDDEDIPYSGEVLDSFQFTNNGLEESIFFN